MSTKTRTVAEDSFGKFTEWKPGVSGLARVYWRVPKRYRKPWETDFKAVLTSKPGQGDLSDPNEVLRIRLEADRLNKLRDAQIVEKEKQVELAVGGAPKVVTFKMLEVLWQTSMTYRSRVGKGRHNHYKTALNHISKHNWRLPNAVDDLVQSDMEAFLTELKPSAQVECKSALSQMYKRGINEGWCTNDPTRGIRFEKRVNKVDLWSVVDLDRMRQAAERDGRPSLSAAMYFAWLIGQRIQDILKLRHGVEYGNGWFEFDQNKTNAKVKVPVTVSDAKLLQSLRSMKHDYLFKDDVTGKPLTYNNLNRNFVRLRRALQSNPETYQKKKLFIKNLRHTCIVRLLEQGSHPVEVAAVSGHAPASIYNIMRAYGIATDKLASTVVTRDHLARGGKIEDFDHDPALAVEMRPKEARVVDSCATPHQLGALSILVAEMDDQPPKRSASSPRAFDADELALRSRTIRPSEPAARNPAAYEALTPDVKQDDSPASSYGSAEQGDHVEHDPALPWFLRSASGPRPAGRRRRTGLS